MYYENNNHSDDSKQIALILHALFSETKYHLQFNKFMLQLANRN